MTKLDKSSNNLRDELIKKNIDFVCVGTGSGHIYVYVERVRPVENIPTNYEGFEVEIKRVGKGGFKPIGKLN